MDNIFDPQKLKKLNNSERLKDMPPEYIWEKLNLNNPDTIIDIGAGTGFFSVPFLNLMGKGKVYSCDISEVMIDWMKNNICLEHKGIIPLLMKDSSVNLGDSSADLVVMINLHHELDNPKNLLKEALRLLKSGGKVCIIDWKKEEMKMGPSIDIRISTDDVSAQLKQSGFKNLKIDNSLSKQFIVIGEK